MLSFEPILYMLLCVFTNSSVLSSKTAITQKVFPKNPKVICVSLKWKIRLGTGKLLPYPGQRLVFRAC